jgi:mono/diheme cytochrome c family protein
MLKSAIALICAGLIAMYTAPTVQKGVADLIRSVTHLNYYPIRDMRRSVVIPPQKLVYRAPDDASVPTIGKDVEMDRDVAAEKLHNPIPASPAATARGDTLFHRLCVPCHGMTMQGNGPVAANFMPPPDLLAQQTRERKDGYIYSYIRHGGVVMPSYGFQVSAEEAWDIIHYLRAMQKASPR